METNSDAEEPLAHPTPDAPVEAAPAELSETTAPLAEAAETEASTDATPAPDAEQTDGPAEGMPIPVPSAPPADELEQLVQASVKARLAQVEEERLTTLLKETLLNGRAGVARSVEILPRLPWIVAVRAVEQTWAELSGGFRTQLLAGLAKDETDAARRIRLSLARALFKIDVPVAVKVAIGVLKDLRDRETGVLSQRNAQIISNVFIGRGKPWMAQMPLTDLKPAEVDVLVNTAVLAVFTAPHPPVTQLGLIKWAKESDRLDKLQDIALEVLVRNVSRWSGKWQAALRAEVVELPEAILAVLKPVREGEAAAPAAEGDARSEEAGADSPAGRDVEDDDDDDEEEDDEDSEEAGDSDEPRTRKKERPVYEPRPQREPQSGDRDSQPRERDSQRERPVYTPRNGGAGAGGGRNNFNLTEALRSIETHVQSLRSELAAAQGKLRQRDDDRRPRRSEKTGPIIEGEPTPEELARLNVQLEARNQELQTRIDELAQHSEDVATSIGAMSGEPVTDSGAQLRTLLALKLQEDFADFAALEQESHDLVVQQHYRTLIRHIFEVLSELQIPLHAAPAADA